VSEAVRKTLQSSEEDCAY